MKNEIINTHRPILFNTNDTLDEKISNAFKQGILEATQENINLTDDWKMYLRNGSDLKYGRVIFSERLEQVRKSTISEFYGHNGIVD